MASKVDWRVQRRSGMAAIAVSTVISLLLWLALYRLLPPLAGMDSIGARMLVALKCAVVATLFVLAFSAQRLRMPAADGLRYRRGEAG